MPYLPETLDSILDQSFRDFEIIALDDGSNDGTSRYLSSIRDKRLRLVRLNKVGLPTALNHGLQLAKAPFIARIDADDVALPERLELQYRFLTERPDCVAVGCQSWRVDGEGRYIEDCTYPTGIDAIRWEAMFRCPVLHPGVMFRRQEILDEGGYNREFDVAQDYELWTRLLLQGKVLANLPEFLIRYRVHDRMVGVVQQDRQIQTGSRIAGAYAAALGAGLDPSTMSSLYMFLATGRPQPDHPFKTLVDAFHKARAFFLGEECGENAELALAIKQQQQNLRWRCTALAEQNWLRPWRGLSWLRYASLADPGRQKWKALFKRGWLQLASQDTLASTMADR